MKVSAPHQTRFLVVSLILGLVTMVPGGPAGAGFPESGPHFSNYTAPPSLGEYSGEPSIGVNWKTGNVMFQANTETLRVSFNDAAGSATWKKVGFPTTSVVTLDPILYTDSVTGQTVVSQLAPPCTVSAVTPDDGNTWIPSTGCSIPGGADHQTIGGGPLREGVGVTTTRGIYYCAQDIVAATCGVSRDGGVTYGPAVPVYTFTPWGDMQGCGPLHGHVKVAPDGTAYLPHRTCNAGLGLGQAVFSSDDDGLTWRQHMIPDATSEDGTSLGSDPSVAIGADGTVYFAYEDDNGWPKVTVSRDKGKTWTPSFDLGTPSGIRYGVFPAAVAGDGDRAAVAFLGARKATSSAHAYQDAAYDGVWHLYVSYTDDRGATWATVDATPTDPVQRGCILIGDSACPPEQRNLLDFMDATVDAAGHVLVGYADGCVGPCVAAGPNSRTSIATIARQTSGASLSATGHPPAALDGSAAISGGEVPSPDRHLQGVKGQVGAHVIDDLPTHRRAGVQVED